MSVDIVIISYDGKPLPRAIRSIVGHHNDTGIRIIVQEKKQSIPKNVNDGARLVETEWFVLFNDDWEAVEDGWLDRLLFHTSKPGIGFISCRVVFPDGTLNHCGYFISENGMVGNMGRNDPDHALPDQFMDYAHPILINTDAFRSIGGYDEDTFKGSQFADIDFVYRMCKSGRRIFFTGSVPLLHHYNENKATKGLRERVRAENERRFRTKHGFGKHKYTNKTYRPPKKRRNG